MNFWATWCSPCLKELPDISAFVTQHKDKVAAIGLDFEDTDKADVVKFLQTHHAQLSGRAGRSGSSAEGFRQPKGLPNTYVIAPDGHVAKAFLGPITTKDLEAAIAGG